MSEQHPIEPWLPDNARLLMCGTFPPPMHRFSMHFYYPNFINDMWRIFGLILMGNKDIYVDAKGKTFREEEIKKMLAVLGIALSDTGREVRRLKDNASDKYLEIIRPIDLSSTLSHLPECTAIATTGEKAASVIATQTGTALPKCGESVPLSEGTIKGINRTLLHFRMPSSSRAYPLSLTSKARAYAEMLYSIGILPSPYFPHSSIPEA